MAGDGGTLRLKAVNDQFVKPINQAKMSLKSLEAESKLAAAQFKATGDAETYSATKTKLLSDQMKSLDDVVNNATQGMKALEESGQTNTKEYEKLRKSLADAKKEMLELRSAANETGETLDEVGEDADSASESLKSIDKSTKLTVLTNALGKADQLLTNMLRSIVEIGKGLWDMGRGAAEWGDTLSTDAQKYGIDTETLQRWQAAEKQVNVTVEDIIKATDKITAATKGVEDDVALIMAGSGQIGVQIRDSTGAMRSQMDIFWDYVEALGKVENETERNALAQEIFGKSYRELIPLIEAGRESWEEAAQNASVVTGEDVEKLNGLNDTFDELLQNWQTTKMTLLAQLAPAFEKVADALDYMVTKLKEWAESPEGQAAMQRMGDAVAHLIETVAEGDFFETLFEDATKALETIASLLEKISGDDIKNGLMTIAGIIAGIKFTNATVNTINALHAMGFGMGGRGLASAAASGGASAASGAAASGGSFLAGLGGTAFTLAGVAGGTYLFGKAVDEAVHEIERGYNDTNYATGTTGYDTENQSLFNWRGYLAKTGKELRYGSDIANSSIKFPQEFLYWDAEKGSGTFANFSQNLNDAYVKMGEALAQGLISESDYYKAEGQLDKAQELWNAFVYGNNEQGVYGFKDYNHVLNELTGGSAESGVQEYAEFVAIIDGILGDVDKLTSGFEEGRPVIQDAGSEMTASFAEGALDNIDAAFAAGEALGAAFTAGVGSGTGGSPTTTNYNSRYIGAVNINGIFTAAEMAAAVRQETERQQAGYGG